MTQVRRNNDFGHSVKRVALRGTARYIARARVWIACAALVLTVWIGTPACGEQVDSFTEPYRTIDVASPEPGIVATIAVNEGDPVRRGQLLVTLDADVLTASLEIARAQMQSTGKLDAARAERKLCATRVEKLRKLRDDGHVSQNELEGAETNLEVANAKVRLAEEERKVSELEFERIETQIRRRSIHSPADGVVTKVYREAGEAILGGDPAILTLVQLDPLRVRFPVSVGQAARFNVGESVDVTFPGTSQRASAQVQIVAPVTDAGSGTVLVTLTIANTQRLYRSGMRCILEVSSDAPTSGRKDGGKPHLQRKPFKLR